MVSGNGQVTFQYYNSVVPLVVQAADASGKPVANLPVTWTITAGYGTIVSPTATTDANGRASTLYRGDVIPGYSFSQQTVTASSTLGSVNFVETTVVNVWLGNIASMPLVQLLSPAPDSRTMTAVSGSTISKAISVNVTAVTGIQSGMPIPNVGMRMIDANNETAEPPARCSSAVLTDASGNATCDLLVTAPAGTYMIAANVGEFVNTPGIILKVTGTATCTYNVSAISSQFTSGGGTANVIVNTASTCPWTANSNTSWISLLSGGSGTGYGGANFTIAPNTGAARSGTVTVAGQTVTLNQSAPAGATGQPLSIVTAALPTGIVNAPYTAALAASGGVPPYRWTLTGNPPTGLTLNPSTGSITGTPTAAGTYTLPLTVTDNVATVVNKTFSLSVVTASSQSPPSITNTGFPNAAVGVAYQQILNSVGPCAGVFSAPPVYTLSSGALPGGLNVTVLDDNRRYAVAGTPTTAGTFNFTITVTDSCGGSSSSNFSITVGGSGTGTGTPLSAAPASVGMATAAGSNPQDANVSLTGTAGASFTAAVSSAGSWLSVTPASGTLPATLVVHAASSAGFQIGSASGSIVISTSTGTLTVPVTVTATGAATVLVASPPSINVEGLSGGQPVPMYISVTNASGPAGFTILPNVVNGAGWLTVTSSSPVTPATLTVTLNPQGLPVATYSGSIQLMPNGGTGTPVSIPVTFRVLSAGSIVATPASLSFTGSATQTPPDQNISVATSGLAVDATITASTSSGGLWLFADPQRTSTPATVRVSVNSLGMAPGTYTGTIVISSGTQTVTPLSIPVTLTIPQGIPVVNSVLNAASYLQPGAVAPGEIVTIFGTGMGPATLQTSAVTLSNTIDTYLAQTMVTFDGYAAPIVYTSSNQVSVIVPYEIDGRANASLQVVYQGQRSAVFNVKVVSAAPGIFTANSRGTGAASAFNQDGSQNGDTNGALPGSIVVFYATGEGQTLPGGQDGLLALSVYPKPVLPVKVTIGGLDAEVAYAGAVPSYTAGLMQINARVPTGVVRGAAVPVILSVGGIPSQAGVSVSIR